MRVIRGKFKNKKLYFPNNLITRPLKDSVKENIFNILEHSQTKNFKIKNCKIMDLYAGSGSFGIECLSRDASEVIFVEKDREAIKNLKKNVEQLNLDEKYKIIERDIYDFIKNTKFKIKFDIIFLDPPYKEKKINLLIKKIDEFDLLKKKGIVIIHRHKNEKDIFTNKFKILIEKKYGISKIIFGKIV